MVELAEAGFEAWNSAYPPPLHTSVSRPLTATSVVLFEDLILSGIGGPSGWQSFDSPRQLAGYLLHVCLPDLATWWLGSSSFGESSMRMPLRDTVEAAADAAPQDRAILLGIADTLETALAGCDLIDFGVISGALERFTAQFGDTPSGRFMLIAFPDTVSAGAALWERLEGPATSLGDECTESQWLDLCARAGADPAAAQTVAAAFAADLTV